jgi:hypothetical protein
MNNTRTRSTKQICTHAASGASCVSEMKAQS